MVKEKWAANSIGEIQAATVRSGVMDKLLRTLHWQCRSVHLVTFVLLVALAVDFFGYDYLNLKSQILKSRQAGARMAVGEHHGPQAIKLSRIVYPQPDVLRAPRTDVPVLTLWLAPIVWEGTFNIDILDEQFQRHNVTIGLTVFAVGRYIGYLKAFLQTAEGHFMVGHRVNYYIFTDQPDSVPQILLQKRRQMVILKVQSYPRWQDISMSRMETISIFSQERFHREVNYLVCVDVDVTFRGHVGVEILSSLFGTLHPAYYAINRQMFPYERDPQSQASILADEGDFYYTAALFGGSVPEVYRLTKACHQAMMMDQTNHIEAVWHDESHLNKYLLYHKPTKVLSPEYMCNEAEECLWFQIQRALSTIIQRVRLVALQKNMSYVRPDERSIQRGSENGNGSQPHSFS